MAETTSQAGPSRDFGAVSQISTIVATDFRQQLTSRKTIALFLVQLIPVVVATVYVFFENVDGLAMFSETVESVTFPFLMPLAALFYGGPALVDEMEGRTLTYLTLRPVAKPALFIGKWLSGSAIASGLVLIPVVLLLIISAISAGDINTSAATIGKILVTTIAGTAAYTAIFAALGAAFARSLIASIVYFVVVEIIFSMIPTLELLSLRFHMNAAAEFGQNYRPEVLGNFGISGPIEYQWWIGLAIIFGYVGAAVLAGSAVFSNKQYHV
ncbi:MAG: ABC transporter permease [Myxococcota bacterium]